MKRIRCPKCDEPILFDDSLYTPGRTLIFECNQCRKQFKIRVGAKAAPVADTSSSTDFEQQETEIPEPIGYLVVLENAFHFRQEIPLYEGENRVGRYVKGTKANAAIKTVDPSVDNTHCIITARANKQGNLKFVLRDGPSGTGTFLMNELVGVKEQIVIDEGSIITIGATTMILHRGIPNDQED